MNQAKKTISPWFIVLFLVSHGLLWAGHAMASETLTHKEWPRTRSGRIVMSIPAIRSIRVQFEKTPDSQIMIRYPGGDLGNAWAFDVRNWLVSLGIAAENIVLEPGSDSADTLILEVRKRLGI